MSDRRRQLGTFAVLSLVLLRLAIGWHFYREGSSKLSYDKATRKFDVTFSAEGFLSQAKGPLAKHFRSLAPSGHGWNELLAVAGPEAAKSGGEAAAAPYDAWKQRITDDWKKLLTSFSAIPGLSDEQKRAANEAYEARVQELADYLASQSEAIAEYQHDLSRIDEMRRSPEAAGVPFVERRIESQTAQSRRHPLAWVDEVTKLDQQFVSDLRNLVTPEQKAEATTATVFEEALTTDEQKKLQITNIVVAALTTGVGICLLVGFFTRLASLAGAFFLASVIATQPPWIPGTAATYYQTAEMAALLVLAGTGAGRWAGLDYFSYALWSRIRGHS